MEVIFFYKKSTNSWDQKCDDIGPRQPVLDARRLIPKIFLISKINFAANFD